MKKFVVLFVGVFVFMSAGYVIISCEKSESDAEVAAQGELPFSSMQRNIVMLGSFDQNQLFTYYIPQDTLLHNMERNLLKLYNINVTLTNIRTFVEDGEFHLSASNRDFAITEVLRLPGGGAIGDAYGEGIACSSTVCAEYNVCIPNKKKLACIGCNVALDCKKTVTARSMFEAVLDLSEKVE